MISFLREINELCHENAYDVWNVYYNNMRVRRLIDSLRNGIWSSNPDEFRLIYNDLMLRKDEFFVLADFDAYVSAQARVEQRYLDKYDWAKTMLINIAQSGYFSSDRTIEEYVQDIWHLTPIQFDEQTKEKEA